MPVTVVSARMNPGAAVSMRCSLLESVNAMSGADQTTAEQTNTRQIIQQRVMRDFICTSLLTQAAFGVRRETKTGQRLFADRETGLMRVVKS